MIDQANPPEVPIRIINSDLPPHAADLPSVCDLGVELSYFSGAELMSDNMVDTPDSHFSVANPTFIFCPPIGLISARGIPHKKDPI